MAFVTVLTGASRGMGRAMALQLLQPGKRLLCLARHTDPLLAQAAQNAHAHVEQWTADLAQADNVAQRLQAWLDTLNPADWEGITLINNAGVIPALMPLAQVPPAELTQALRVGLEAPMQLTAAFLHATAHWTVARKVLNISSGLGRRAMASCATYCAAKAGMDHFTRCLAMEEALKPHGARVCSLAPGVVDTDMQVQLRGADPSTFPDQGGFAQLHAQGQLTSPDEAARRVLAYLRRPDFGDTPVADVRDIKV